MDKSQLYAYCLQGDIVAAYKYLRSFPDKPKKYQQLELKYTSRFFSENPVYRFKSQDPWIRKVLKAYYKYFTAVLTKKSANDAERQLILALQPLVSNHVNDLDSLEERLEDLFQEKGFHFLGGVTPPYRGPYIWKTQEKRDFVVELPYGTQEVTVYFLSDFILLGWAHFATFGERYAGGWAKPDGLYYVCDTQKRKRTELDSSWFQISYLKHEAQHLSDYANFPNLPPKDLEYRAKLVELIYEHNPMRLLNKFHYEQKNEPALPHPYSSYILMKQLSHRAQVNHYGEWNQVNTDRINQAAHELFDQHSTLLENSSQDISIGII
jgi:hypothetical protein